VQKSKPPPPSDNPSSRDSVGVFYLTCHRDIRGRRDKEKG
jgi:hypothetical protein